MESELKQIPFFIFSKTTTYNIKTIKERKEDKKMENRVYGYARVSTSEQNLDRQIRLFKEKYKIEERNIFYEKVSGRISGRERPVFGYLLDVVLRAGDVLVVDSLNRLGRNYADILKNWNTLSQLKIYIVVDDMPILDTRPKKYEGDILINKLIVNLVAQLLAYFAEREVQEKKRAQLAGIKAARAAGKKMGRPRVEFPENFKEEYIKWKKGEQTAVRTMRKLYISHSTFYRLVKKFEEENKIK